MSAASTAIRPFRSLIYHFDDYYSLCHSYQSGLRRVRLSCSLAHEDGRGRALVAVASLYCLDVAWRPHAAEIVQALAASRARGLPELRWRIKNSNKIGHCVIT